MYASTFAKVFRQVNDKLLWVVGNGKLQRTDNNHANYCTHSMKSSRDESDPNYSIFLILFDQTH